MTQEEIKTMFKRHINNWLDYFCNIHKFNGDITDLQIFIFGLEPRGPNEANMFGESIQDIMEKNGHKDLLDKLLEGNETTQR